MIGSDPEFLIVMGIKRHWRNASPAAPPTTAIVSDVGINDAESDITEIVWR